MSKELWTEEHLVQQKKSVITRPEVGTNELVVVANSSGHKFPMVQIKMIHVNHEVQKRTIN